MNALALGVLIYFLTVSIWDLLEPDAVRIEFNSNFRLAVATVAQLSILALSLVVLGATPIEYAGVGAWVLVLSLLTEARKRSH